MGKIIEILNFEEGFKTKPYIDTEGYPTVGTGFLIGPKGVPLSNYTFMLPKEASDVWLQSFVNATVFAMQKKENIAAALKACNVARADILTSMAYQLGVDGLAGFTNTLKKVATGDFTGASAGMLDSKWARQTPARARRHAQVMTSGDYDAYKGLI